MSAIGPRQAPFILATESSWLSHDTVNCPFLTRIVTIAFQGAVSLRDQYTSSYQVRWVRSRHSSGAWDERFLVLESALQGEADRGEESRREGEKEGRY
jgi:hypothetical protein